MLFNSYSFLFLFLPLFLLVWQITARRAELCLLVFSVIFYALWGLSWFFLLAFMICLNYCLGLGLAWKEQGEADPKAASSLIISRRALLIVAVCLNLLPLAWFKYSASIVANLAALVRADWPFAPPGLPLGISFYTFIQIAWLVGVYRGQFQPPSLLRHAVFSGAFPYIISGPIVRYDQLGWQFDQLGPSNAAGLARGFTLFGLGLAKKALLGDSIGVYADTVFNAAAKSWPLTSPEAWLGSLCYTFQLYFDFSGYTDMALGLGLMIGLRLPENFNSPYKSTGIVDFWRRWHITLSSWLRDYLYIPLGGNRKGRCRQYLNLFLTMLLGGAWHGAGWTFVIWGALHGLMLGVNHFFRTAIRGGKTEALFQLMPMRLACVGLTFFCLNFCWVFFRAPTPACALAMYKAMFATPFATSSGSVFDFAEFFPNSYFSGWTPFCLLIVCACLCWFCPNSRQILSGESRLLPWRPTAAWATGMAILVFAALIMLSRQSVFLYFQF